MSYSGIIHFVEGKPHLSRPICGAGPSGVPVRARTQNPELLTCYACLEWIKRRTPMESAGVLPTIHFRIGAQPPVGSGDAYTNCELYQDGDWHTSSPADVTCGHCLGWLHRVGRNLLQRDNQKAEAPILTDPPVHYCEAGRIECPTVCGAEVPRPQRTGARRRTTCGACLDWLSEWRSPGASFMAPWQHHFECGRTLTHDAQDGYNRETTEWEPVSVGRLDQLALEGWEVVCPLADGTGYLLRRRPPQ